MSDFPMTHDENDDPPLAPVAGTLQQGDECCPSCGRMRWPLPDVRETIRRYGLGEDSRIFMLLDDQPDSAGHYANLEDHREVLAQRDALRATVAQLRSELAHQSALWQTALGHAAEQQAEVERLQSQLVHDAAVTLEQHCAQVAEIERQRDALADALQGLQAWIAGSNILRSRPSLMKARAEADAAPRLVGRLPEVPDGRP
jgi:hypothetical protein